MALINKEQEYQDQEAWSNDVEKLKGYKEFTEKVEWWAKQNNGSNYPVINGPYEIVFDNELGWCVDVDGDVSFVRLDIEEIPFQFRNVNKFFNCGYCKNITSLKGCPVYVGYCFDCSECYKLASLEHCPKEVKHIFFCNNCKNLTSLECCPKEIGGDFGCGGCRKLTSLEGCPKEVGGDFDCDGCPRLTSLEYCPKEVGGDFLCDGCYEYFSEEYIKSLCKVKGEIYNGSN